MPCSCGQVMIGSAGTWLAEKNWLCCGLECCLGNGCRLKRRQVRKQAESTLGTAAG